MPTFFSLKFSKNNNERQTVKYQKIYCNFYKTKDGLVKPITIVCVGGGSNENPLYTKVLLHGIKYFKENNLDGLFVATNAPGRITYKSSVIWSYCTG